MEVGSRSSPGSASVSKAVVAGRRDFLGFLEAAVDSERDRDLSLPEPSGASSARGISDCEGRAIEGASSTANGRSSAVRTCTGALDAATTIGTLEGALDTTLGTTGSGGPVRGSLTGTTDGGGMGMTKDAVPCAGAPGGGTDVASWGASVKFVVGGCEARMSNATEGCLETLSAARGRDFATGRKIIPPFSA